MVTVTIPKKEYQELVERALQYEYLQEVMREGIFSPPPTRNHKNIMDAFRRTKKYSKKFLTSLSQGLRRSDYFSV